MEFDRLNYLKEKYWKGKTSPEEELELKRYFMTNDDTEHPEMADYFRTLGAFNHLKPSGNLQIDFSTPSSSTTRLFSLSMIRNIAAVLLLAIGLGVVWNINQKAVVEEEVYSQAEIEESYQEARQALLLIAAKLDKGKSTINEIEHFSETTERVLGMDYK